MQVDCETNLETILLNFKKGKSHVGIVTKLMERNEPLENEIKTIGILTLEDVIKSLLTVEHNEDETYKRKKVKY